jgi:acetylornithine/succinyldiaminopimelate/putrescine aminotransferase
LADPGGRTWLDWWNNSGAAPLGAQSAILDRACDWGPGRPLFVSQIHPFEPRDRLAKRWCAATDMDKAFFTNGGTEAIETAIKLLRLVAHRRGRSGIIYALKDSFHGRTYGAMSAGSGPEYHYEGFGPFVSGFDHFERPQDIDPDKAIGILVTPLQCYKDSYHYDDEWWESLGQLLLRHPHIGLAFDDIQTGAGRCGELSMANWSRRERGVNPDIVCLGKGVALGYPLTITLARGEYADAFAPGQHFCTFGGASVPPIFAAHAMLDWLMMGGIEQIKERSQFLLNHLQSLPWVKNLRGAGLMWSVEADGVTGQDLSRACMENGLIATAFGAPLKIFPQLNSSQEWLTRGVQRLDRAYAAARRSQ